MTLPKNILAFLLAASFSILARQSMAQKTLTLSEDLLDLNQPRKFYIAKVWDARQDTVSGIGEGHFGLVTRPRPIAFPIQTGAYLKQWFDKTVPRSEGQIPVTVKLELLECKDEKQD